MAQRENEEREASHRLLAAAAVCAQLLWHVLVAGPPAAGIVFGLLWFGAPLAWIVGVGGAAFAFFAWLLSPQSHLEGCVVRRDEAPALFGAIDDLRVALAAPPIHEVRLTDELNAAAYQRSWAGLPAGARQTLVLGIPLLAILRPSEAAAVIAHELGHFSRRHGLFGHWIYRARWSWMALAQPSEPDDSAYERVVQRFASTFGPWFAKRSFLFSRRCEYEADRDASSVASATDLVLALQRVDIASQRFERWHHHEQTVARLQSHEVPADRWTRMLEALAAEPASPAERETAWARRPQADDTHPSLTQRARSLTVSPSDLAPSLPPPTRLSSAGHTWLGARWETVLGELNAAWRARHEREWRADSIHLARIQARQEALGDSTSERVERARLLALLGRNQESVSLLRRLGVEDVELPPAARYSVCVVRLAAGDVSAIAAIEALIAREPALALAARRLLLDSASVAGDEAAMEKNRVLLDRAERRVVQASEKVHAAVESGQLAAPRLPREAIDAFCAQCETDPLVRRTWLGFCDVENANRRVFGAHVIVVQIDPAIMLAAGVTEPDVEHLFERQLVRWREGPHQIVVARVCFTTEEQLPHILDRDATVRWQRPPS